MATHKIIFNVSSKELNYPECIKLTADKSYVDTVIRNKEYFGESQISISFTNLCTKIFNVPTLTLFTNTENGGTFQARVSAFSIGQNQTLNIPLKYYGSIKTVDNVKTFIISLNGTNSPLQLNISENVIQYPPVITDVIINVGNRESRTLYLSDFSSKFTDPNGDTLASILLSGDLSTLRLNGAPISSPIEISAYLLSVGALQYIGQNTDEEVNVIATLKARDSNGLISL